MVLDEDGFASELAVHDNFVSVCTGVKQECCTWPPVLRV